MKKNMGTIDIIVRLVIAALLVVLYFTQVLTGITGIILLIIAGVLTLTSIFSICPLYMAFGISTRSRK
jgi:hypothetical protein